MTVPELREWIRRYTTEGATLQQLADEAGRSIATVHRQLRRAGVELRPTGITTRPHPRRLPESALRQTVELYAEGRSVREVAEILGIVESSARYRLQRAGVRLRSKSEAARPEMLRRISQQQEDAIVRLYALELRSQRAVAAEVGVSITTVRRALRRRGMRTRDNAQATRIALGKPPGKPSLKVRRFKAEDERKTPSEQESGQARGRVPAAPLVPWIEAACRQEDGAEGFAELSGVSERLLFAWRVGERRDATWNSAERILVALDRCWWEVYDPAYARPRETFSGDRGRDVVAWIRAAEMAVALWDAKPAVGEQVVIAKRRWVIESWDAPSRRVLVASCRWSRDASVVHIGAA